MLQKKIELGALKSWFPLNFDKVTTAFVLIIAMLFHNIVGILEE